MLVIMCQAGGFRFAIAAADVVEVLPLVNVQEMPDGAPWQAGVFAHRHVATPVIDLPRLITGQPCPRRRNTRTILLHVDRDGLPRQVGVLAERVTTAEIDVQAPAPGTTDSTARASDTLGPALLDEQGVFQLVDVSRLFDRQHGLGARLTQEQKTL